MEEWSQREVLSELLAPVFDDLEVTFLPLPERSDRFEGSEGPGGFWGCPPPRATDAWVSPRLTAPVAHHTVTLLFYCLCQTLGVTDLSSMSETLNEHLRAVVGHEDNGDLRTLVALAAWARGIVTARPHPPPFGGGWVSGGRAAPAALSLSLIHI